MTASIQIFSALQKKLSDEEFKRLYDIIINAYAETEHLMWGKNYVRVPPDAFRQYLMNDEVLVAFMEGEVVGGLRYYEQEPGTFSFGLFGADFSKSRMGIGKALIARVEEEARRRGAKQISIEILRPQQFELPIKTILHDWYQRLGYAYTHSEDFEQTYPERAKGILVPCNFDYYLKAL